MGRAGQSGSDTEAICVAAAARGQLPCRSRCTLTDFHQRFPATSCRRRDSSAKVNVRVQVTRSPAFLVRGLQVGSIRWSLSSRSRSQNAFFTLYESSSFLCPANLSDSVRRDIPRSRRRPRRGIVARGASGRKTAAGRPAPRHARRVSIARVADGAGRIRRLADGDFSGFSKKPARIRAAHATNTGSGANSAFVETRRIELRCGHATYLANTAGILG